LVNWRPIAAGEAEAREHRRAILYEFSAAWCGPCRLMKQDLFARRDVARRIEALLVPVSVVDRARELGSNPPEIAALEDRFHITAFPTLVVVRDDGATERLEGYPGADKTMEWLHSAAIGPRDAYVRKHVPAFMRPDSATMKLP
jgi:thiol:disulfide interchange protein